MSIIKSDPKIKLFKGKLIHISRRDALAVAEEVKGDVYRWFWAIILAPCLIVLASLALSNGTRAQAEQPVVTSTPARFIPLPTIMKNSVQLNRQGDWVVTANEVVQNTDVLLEGNLIVQRGGILTLRHVGLTLNGRYNGQYGVRVQAGGGITIEGGSLVTAAQDSGRLTFIVDRDASFTMRDSELHRCGWGIPYESWGYEDTAGLVIYADNAVLERNLFSNNYTSVSLRGSGNGRISDNQFFANTWSGVYSVGTGRGTQIAGNSFADGRHGIVLLTSTDNVITGNSFSRHYEGAIFLFSSWNNEIGGNHTAIDGESFRGWAGVELDKVSGNNRVLNNTFSGGKNGVTVHHSPNNTIRGNTVTGAVQAMVMGYADGNLIADNVFSDIGSGFSYGALVLYHSSNNQILDNRVGMIGEASGVLLLGSSMNNTFESNIITSTFRGLFLHSDANNNTIVTNTISVERGEAIVVYNSSDNLIHHNNFLKSGEAPHDNSRNHWDDGTTGNYWHDYGGTGAYAIPPNGVDRYPLDNPITVISVPVPELPSIPAIPPPYRPPWIITQPTVIENQAITVEDTLIIESGGSLTLKQATLWIDGGRDFGGIVVQSGGGLFVSNSTIAATAVGGGYLFQAQPGSTLVLQGSEVRGVGFTFGPDWGGIYVATDRTVIENTLITDTFEGLVVESPAVGSHRVTGNTVARCYMGITLYEQSNSLIRGNQVKDCIGWGIQVGGGFGNAVTGNTIANIWYWGSLGVGGVNHVVLSNRITSQLTSQSFGWGINVTGESHQIAGNVISDVRGTGIGLTGQGHAVVSNTVMKASNGINLSQAHGNTIIGNRVVSAAIWAISLGESSDNEILGNTVSDSWGGINLYKSSQNLFYHNNFLSNFVQARDDGSNQWDSEGQGNYWSDYDGIDNNGDGIGDTPYVIPSHGIDHYPLMLPYEIVSIPSPPIGPTRGTPGASYSYSTIGSTSNLGHSTEYQFDWKGDGTDLSSWGSATQSKSWTLPGTYTVKARARCATHTSVMSGWSTGLSVTISTGGNNTATRDLPDCYTPSASSTVSITVTPSATTQTYAVEETPPNGWTVSNINENGQWDNVSKKVKWGPFFDHNNRTLTYNVTPPSGETGAKTFSGTAGFDAASVAIGGESSVGKCVSTPHPADTNDDYRMGISEVTAYGAAWKTGQTWPTPPNPIPIEYVTNAAYLWKMGEVYHYDGSVNPPWVTGAASVQSITRQVSLQIPMASGTGSAATRTLPGSYEPSVVVNVSISVNPGQGTQVYAVEETPPSGWVVTDINESGQWDSVNRRVKWGPFFDNNIRTLTYKATPPAGETGSKTFSGTVSFDGNNVSIGGDQTIFRPTTGFLFDFNRDEATDAAAFHLPTNQFFVEDIGNLGQFGWGGSEFMPITSQIAVYNWFRSKLRKCE